MAENAVAGDLVSFLRGLRAVRQFRPEPVPEEVVRDVLEVARWTGSARNLQPWELILVRDRETLEALARVRGYAGHLAGASVGIVLVMAGEREEQETYDEGRLSERILLAALAHGVGSSIGWLVGDGRDAAKALLGVPEERVVRTAISLGYTDEEPPLRGRSVLPQARKPLDAFVYEERFGQRVTG